MAFLVEDKHVIEKPQGLSVMTQLEQNQTVSLVRHRAVSKNVLTLHHICSVKQHRSRLQRRGGSVAWRGWTRPGEGLVAPSQTSRSGLAAMRRLLRACSSRTLSKSGSLP